MKFHVMLTFSLTTICFIKVLVHGWESAVNELTNLDEGKEPNGNDGGSSDDITFDNITFVLYTRNINGTVLNRENLKILDSRYPVVLIIHGWKSAANNSWVIDMAKAFTTYRGPINVIAVDWSGIADKFYVSSRYDTAGVGDLIAEFVIFLAKNYFGSNYKKFQCAGHSLGAQICGYTGQMVKKRTGSLILVIYGLDPAGPLFILASDSNKLTPDDALLVVVVHTDRGVYGIMEDCGHVDIYPNGGTPVQPGCSPLPPCSHNRAYLYFIEAIQYRDAFKSRKCDDYDKYKLGECFNNNQITIGGKITLRDKGKYFHTTNSKSPYSRNEKLVKPGIMEKVSSFFRKTMGRLLSWLF